MYILFHQQINIISAFVLLLFLVYALNALDRKFQINKIYIFSLSLNLLIIGLDIAYDYLLLKGSVSVKFPRVLGALVFILSPILPYLFLQFVCSYFSSPFKITRLAKTIFKGFMILNAIVAIFSFKSRNFIESISITVYTLPFLISIIFLVYSIFVIFKCKKMLIHFEYLYIVTLSFLSSTLVLIVLFTSQTNYLWFSSAFIMILMFVVIQQRELYRDSLTGVRNRMVLKKCLDLHSRRLGGTLSVIMIDLDYFKNINDSYGHLEGDYALKIFARLLQKVFSDNGIVIRMGGDEFLILIYKISTLEVNELIKKMSKLVDKYNNKGLKPYRIKYSSACGTYTNSDISIDQFIHDIDLKMYQNKSSKKGRVWTAETV